MLLVSFGRLDAAKRQPLATAFLSRCEATMKDIEA